MDPVIVAGAGPTGLSLALCLARHNVPVVLLDEEGPGAEPRAERTAVLRPRTADLLARLGYTAVHTDAARWTAWRTLRRRQVIGTAVFSSGPDTAGLVAGGAAGAVGVADDSGEEAETVDAGPSPLHLAQDRLRHGLHEALAGQELITVAHGCRLTAVEQDDHGVSVHTRGTGGGPETWWRGSYLVGCDGPRSTVRKLLDVRFPGRTAVDRYAVAALRVALPEPGTALLHRDPPGARGTEATARPLPGGVWRLDWSLPTGMAPLTPDGLVARIRATLSAWCEGTIPAYELLGWSEYPVHQRLARRWRTGRAFLAGDAAHLLGALGTQGLEEGLRDADNLAWKLALAWHHGASDVLLDSYQAERRGAVGTRLRAADQALPPLRANGAWHTLRHSLLSGPMNRHAELLTDAPFGRGLLGAPPAYDRSPLVLPAPRGGKTAPSPLVAPGAGVPGEMVDDVPVIDLDGVRGRLRDRLGRDLLAVLVAPGTGVWESRHWLTAGLMPQLSAAVSALPTRTELLVTESYPGATAHTVLLVRPDGHLVGAMTGCRPAELYAYADLARGGPPPHRASQGDREASGGARDGATSADAGMAGASGSGGERRGGG
ncbi:FAD-dependent monooxygenase [Streptomyces sp. ICBB 8177]|uniref:FAD-dependent monooxygenase n=1 Tax=Streptomyces sp. ICBB 8177 TaxID=563922 RepID=UPI000D67E2DC|nr:FAD-dependent monooxygenase [Streptomyces sp. ICBB 8177]PWI45171.1 monooxygenase [Streptomyces sp. ICBB 8177]